MRALLKAGHALLIQGPAVARVFSGNASTLGKPLELDEPLVVRAGRLKILEAQDEVELDIVTGEGGKLDEVETSTIPPEWSNFLKKIATMRSGKQRIMVLGGVDTGKNTFITYACNKLLKEGLKVAVMDADMGQGEIGPPTTMSVAFLESPVSELLEVSPNKIFFVGSTSPANVVGRVLQGAERLMSFVNENAPEVIMFINMPGWVTGPGAAVFIIGMISKLEVSCIVALQRENEVEDILNGVPPNLELIRLPASSYAKMRSREERKFLRET
nr:Clp1/GlmU family protein [Candidatus Njordarchaeum guaymaensis]